MYKRVMLFLFMLLAVPAGFAAPLNPVATVNNTDFAAFALGGLRDLGSGNIVVTGVTGTVTRAILVWHGPSNDVAANANANVSFNGTPITGTNVGTSDNLCWDMQAGHAYQADVTALVTGNGSYALANFYKVGPPVLNINGASLLVFYNDGVATNNKDVNVFLGFDASTVYSGSPADPAGWDQTLNNVSYTSGAADLTVIMTDGQNGNNNGLSVNGTLVFPVGSWMGAAPNAGGSEVLWDQTTASIVPLLVPGMNSLHLTAAAWSGDCVGLVGAITSVDSLFVPPPPPAVAVPVPASSGGVLGLLVLGLGLSGLILLRRRDG